MSEVKWIKIVTDIFDDEKILLIDGLPEHDAIIVIWFKLLCLAGKQNNGGVFMINDKIAYTDEMLATIFHRPLQTVRLALGVFEKYGMIEIIDDTITIPNWSKHQSLESIELSREATRKRVQKYREKQRQLVECNGECNADCNVTVTLRNGDRTREEKEEEKEKEEDDTSLSVEQTERCPFKKIQELFNQICVSFPKIQNIEGERRKSVSARWRYYKDIEKFKTLFEIAEKSPFLKGQNDRNWSADFDWMMKANNFTKILERKYDDKKPNNTDNDSFGDADDFLNAAIKKGLKL